MAIAGTACAAQSDVPPTAVPPAAVLLVTATSAEPRPALSSAVLASLTGLAAADDACLALIVGQHPPRLFALTPFRRNGKPEVGSQRRARVQANLRAIAAAVAESAEVDSGLDLLAAIRTAIRRAPLTHRLIVLSSGVSTAAPLDLRLLGWGLDPSLLATELHAAEELPRLAGWTVDLVGLGDTSGSQPRLGPALAQRIQRLWTTICTAAEATACEIDNALVSDAAPLATNAVPVVSPPAISAPPHRIAIPEPLLFGLDTAALNPSAESTMKDVAGQILATDQPFVIVGHTDASTGTRTHNAELSLARALAVKAALIARGVPAQRITDARGDGSSGYSALDEAAHPERISQHRSVEIQFR